MVLPLRRPLLMLFNREPGVVAAGANGVILHYEDSDGVFRRGELAMVDLCVEYNHYVSDITRTFPVEGRFTERQAYWYDLCLRAQESIVAHMKPGADMRACGAEAREMVAKALMDNGYIQSPEELPAMIGQCRKDYVTVTGVNHSIGLQCDEVGTRFSPAWSIRWSPESTWVPRASAFALRTITWSPRMASAASLRAFPKRSRRLRP